MFNIQDIQCDGNVSLIITQKMKYYDSPINYWWNLTGSNDKNTAIGLRSSSNHVLDEIPVSGGINDGDVELGSLKLPESDIDGDSTLTLGLQFVKNPCVLERSLTHLDKKERLILSHVTELEKTKSYFGIYLSKKTWTN